MRIRAILLGVLLITAAASLGAVESVKIGMVYPQSGVWQEEGLDHYRGAAMAIKQINAGGGILGRPVELVCGNSAVDTGAVRAEVTRLVDRDHCRILVGGGTDENVLLISDMCQQKSVPFFVTMGLSPDITGVRAHRHTFRECLDSYMASRALGEYLRTHHAGQTFMYLTANGAWSKSIETALRLLTSTEDRTKHKSLSASGSDKDFSKHLALVRAVQPDVLVAIVEGEAMSLILQQAHQMNLGQTVQIAVPLLTLPQAVALGPEATQGVLTASPWYWSLAHESGSEAARKFVEEFAVEYVCHPGSGAASAYTAIQQYRFAVEQAGSVETSGVVARLEGAAFDLLKGPQVWRSFDHQSVQAVYAVKGKPATAVLNDMFNQDFFEVVGSVPGEQVVLSQMEWEAARVRAGLDGSLEPLKEMADR